MNTARLCSCSPGNSPEIENLPRRTCGLQRRNLCHPIRFGLVLMDSYAFEQTRKDALKRANLDNTLHGLNFCDSQRAVLERFLVLPECLGQQKVRWHRTSALVWRKISHLQCWKHQTETLRNPWSLRTLQDCSWAKLLCPPPSFTSYHYYH